MNKVYTFVSEEMTHQDRLICMSDYEQFEANGAIGDCELRNWVSSLQSYLGITDVTYVTFPVIAQSLMFEVYRFYANGALERIRD